MKSRKISNLKLVILTFFIGVLFGLFPHMETDAYWDAKAIPTDGTCQFDNPIGGNDWRFELTTNGTARIEVTTTCKDVKLIISNDMNYSPSSRFEPNAQGYYDFGAAAYYVLVYCENTSSSHTCPNYDISINFTEFQEADKEPNNRFDEAITLKSGKTVEGNVFGGYYDYDYYKFTLTTQSTYYIQLWSLADANGYIYDEDRTLTSTFNASDNSSMMDSYYLASTLRYHASPGTYYLRINPDFNNKNLALSKYKLRVVILETPKDPVITSAKATNVGKVKITWSKSKYAEGYFLYRRFKGTTDWTQIAQIKSGNTTSYTDSVSTGSSYEYGIQAYRVDPFKKKTSHVLNMPNMDIWLYNTGKEVAHSYEAKIPAASNVKATKVSSGKQIKLTWTTAKGVTGYRIYRKENSGSYKLVKTIKSQKTSSWTDTNVKKGVFNTYRINAYYASTYSSTNSAGAFSNQLKLTGSISKPTNVKAKNYGSYHQVTWNKVQNAVGYRVYRKIGLGSYKMVKMTESADKTSFKDTNVKKGKKYTYKVKAYYRDYKKESSNTYSYKEVNSSYSSTSSAKR